MLLGLDEQPIRGEREKEVAVTDGLMSTNAPYSASEATAANASCTGENSGPGRLVVKVGIPQAQCRQSRAIFAE